MDWLEAIPALFTGLVVILVPGLVVTLVLRLRAFDAVALAPLVSATLISVGAILASFAGVTWSFAVPLVAAVVAAGLAFLLRRLTRRQAVPSGALKQGSRPAHELLFFAGAGVAAVIIGFQLVRILGTPDAFSQSFDNIFHLNAVHYIGETGDASSFTVAAMTAGDGAVPFYPAAWHGFASLVTELSGAPLTVGVNAANIVIAAVVWPLSALFAVRQFAKVVPAAVIGGGVLLASFPAFPILLLDFGVLYPNFFSLAMLPAGLALAAIVFRQAPNTNMVPAQGLFLGAAAYPGIALAHPNGIMTLLLLAVPLVVGAYVFHVRALRRAGAGTRSYILPTAALAVGLAVFAVLWNYLRPPEDAAFWGPTETSAQAFGEAILNAPFGRPVALIASILAVVGMLAALKQPRLRWLSVSYVVAIGAFVVVAGFEQSDLRSFITGVWYNDPNRLAAVLPLLSAPLSVLGLSTLLEWVERQIAARRGQTVLAPRRPAALVVAASAVTVLVLLPLTQGRNIQDAVARAAQMYTLTEDSALVSRDELELMDRIDDLVPEDATIAVNPYTGGALAFAFSDRNTTHRHTLDTVSEDTLIIESSLRDADTVPEVCEAARNENLRYVLDLGLKEVHDGDHRYPGIENLDTSPDFELIDEVGDAKLYEFSGCGL